LKADASIEVVGELSLGETPVQQLAQMLHEHSVSGVIISARHTYFEQVENAIKTCELEGVEAWLVADFFGTQISRARFDELLGYPLLVFRTTPETSWPGVAKQLMDFTGALFLLIALFLAVRDCGHPHQIDLARPGFFPPAALRPQRLALHALQIPHHGDQRRAVQTRIGSHE
jgi:hypothetical protein